ncbi:MAG: nitrous oxide reductase family maturation protein NosD [Alphaproteobacteria bacterium]|nr:nitrous oxide reductase family maturation protein NosD [Alphaproteobacteria bacterium]
MRIGTGGVVGALGLLLAAAASADVLTVPAGGDRLAETLRTASAGDVLVLAAGRHAGPLTIDKAVTLRGRPGAVVEGSGEGSTLRIVAPGVTVERLRITGSGLSLEGMDAGVFVSKKGTGARIIGNRIVDNLYGVHLKGSANAVVKDNEIVGRRDLRVNERGNGVSLWNAPGAVVDGNRIRYGRDGVFVTTSKRNRFTNNRFRDLRIAVHYMYADDSVVAGNLSEGNYVGYALMYSKRLKVFDNRSFADRHHGILLNFANRSEIRGNWVRDGEEKCVFIYNSSRNTFARNRFEGCAIGVHFTAGSEANAIAENAFIANRTQVKYVGTRHLDWSADGRGNFWSDNAAFDLDGDGIADVAYRPNDLADKVLWAHPRAKLLLNAPSLRLLALAQGQFPALHPGGVIDTAPLMTAPAMPGAGQR